MAGQQQLGGAAHARTELDHALPGRQGGRSEHAAGQVDAAGAQDPFAQAGQEPVALHAGRLGGRTLSVALTCWVRGRGSRAGAAVPGRVLCDVHVL